MRTALRDLARDSRLLFLTLLMVPLAGHTQEQPSGPAWDGLVEVEASRSARVWLMPGIDMSTYTSMRVEGAGIQFRPVKRRGRNAREFQISEQDRQRLQETAQGIFTEELSKTERFEVVETDGPHTVIVRGALLDVVSNVPPDRAGRSDNFVSVFGEATLAIEILDSESQAVIARAVERRAAQPPGGRMERANAVTTRAEVRRLLRRWAERLRTVLNEVDEFWDTMEPI
jgi:hypothetical protein